MTFLDFTPKDTISGILLLVAVVALAIVIGVLMTPPKKGLNVKAQQQQQQPQPSGRVMAVANVPAYAGMRTKEEFLSSLIGKINSGVAPAEAFNQAVAEGPTVVENYPEKIYAAIAGEESLRRGFTELGSCGLSAEVMNRHLPLYLEATKFPCKTRPPQ